MPLDTAIHRTPIADAVRQAVAEDSDHWKLRMDDRMQRVHFRNMAASAEWLSSFMDAHIMAAAVRYGNVDKPEREPA